MATRTSKTSEQHLRAEVYQQALRDVVYTVQLAKERGGTVRVTRGSSLDEVLGVIEMLESGDLKVKTIEPTKPTEPTETAQLHWEISRLTEEMSAKLAAAKSLAFAQASRKDAEIAALRLKQRPPRTAWTLLFLLVVSLGVVFYAMGQIPEAVSPVACPPIVECPAAPEPTTSTTISPGEGYIVEDEYGTTRFRPWPDATGYPAETFLQDCRAVCAVPAMMSHDPGRVLTADPEHLVCICFHHAGSSLPVTRWINWERQR